MVSRKLNICIFTRITNAHGICGGMERHTDILCEGFVSLGHKVTVITTRHPSNIQYEEIKGVRYYYLEKTRPGLYRNGWGKESIKKFEELNEYNPFDIVLSESTGATSYVLNKNKFKLPVVTILQGTGFTELQSTFKEISSITSFYRFLKRFVSITFDYFYDFIHLYRTDAIIVVSNELNNQVMKEYFINPNKVYTIYNGIDTGYFQPNRTKGYIIRQKYGIKKDEKLIIVSGNLEYQKGIHTAIKAFNSVLNKFNKMKLMVIGKGAYEKKLREMADKLNLANKVIFTGYISYNSIADYYNACDLFLMPTLRVEGFPMVLAEVMACEKTIIASKIGGIPSSIDDGINGILLPPGDINLLSQNIIKVLNDKNFADRLAKNGRQRAVNEFNKEKMIVETIKVFEICLKKQKDLH